MIRGADGADPARFEPGWDYLNRAWTKWKNSACSLVPELDTSEAWFAKVCLAIMYPSISVRKYIGFFFFRCLVTPYHSVFVSSKYLETKYFKSRFSFIRF